MKLYRNKYIENVVTKLYNNSIENDFSKKEKYEFRSSNLPFCPVLYLLNRVHSDDIKLTFSEEFFTSIGTVVHEILQKYMSNTVNVIAEWECSVCKHHHKKPQFRPKKCAGCGVDSSKLVMREISLENVYGLSGHLDFVLQITKGKKPVNVLLDFKTSTANSIKTGAGLPKARHHLQLQPYALGLWQKHRLQIHYYVIVYLSRDLPFKGNMRTFGYKVTKDMLVNRAKILKHSNNGKKAVDKFIGNQSIEGLKHIFNKYRPCVTRKDYDDPVEGMNLAFYGKPCDFITDKGCSYKAVLEDYKDRKRISDEMVNSSPF
jgi:hypothetical protein